MNTLLSLRNATPLAKRLDAICRSAVQAKGKPIFVSVVLMATWRQFETVRDILKCLSTDGLPADAQLDIAVVVTPAPDGSLGEMAAVLDEARTARAPSPRESLHTCQSEPPYRGIPYLFRYGEAVHRGVDALMQHFLEHANGRTEDFQHLVVRVSGDVHIRDRDILARLIRPLTDPRRPDVLIASAVQTSDWDQDELARRWLIQPVMRAYLASKEPFIPCASSKAPGALSAYPAAYFTQLGMSGTWGGGEDGVGFTLLDKRIGAVFVRDAVIEHSHAGRGALGQVLQFSHWLYIAPITKLIEWSARTGNPDLTAAYTYFMTSGIIADRSLAVIRKVGRFTGHIAVIQVLSLYHTARICLILLGGMARGAARRLRTGRDDAADG